MDELIKRKATRNESVPAPVQAKVACSGSLQSQRKSVDLKDIQPGSPVETMSSAGVPKQCPTTGRVGAKLPAAGV